MPAISVLGTDYASITAWFEAERNNDYSGAGPILEVPRGLGAIQTADLTMRYGSASKFTIRAVSGDECVGDIRDPASIATVDCGGFELDFRQDNIVFEDVYLRNWAIDATGDTQENCGFRRCVVEGYLNLDQGRPMPGFFIEDTVAILVAGYGSTERVAYVRYATDFRATRSTLINKAGGSGDAVIVNRSTLALTLEQTVVISLTNDAYMAIDAPPAPTASNNAATDGTLPGAVITDLDTTIFEDYANGDYRIKGGSAPAQMATQAGAFIQPDAQAPLFSDGPNATNSTTNGHDITATISEDGDVFAVRMTRGATAPTSAAVKAGVVTGDLLEAKTIAATANDQVSMTFNTGSAETDYDYYVVAEDGAGNLQATPVLLQATTLFSNPCTITDVDTDEIILNGQTDVVIAGLNFGATQDTGRVFIGSVEQIVTAWADTSITIDNVQGGLNYGVHSLSVTNDIGSQDTISIQLRPGPGYDYVTLTDVSESSISSTPPLEVGDQVEHDLLTDPDGYTVDIDQYGHVSVDGGNAAGQTFNVRVWDHVDGTWGAYALQTGEGGVFPNISFTPVFDAEPGQTYTSNMQQITGISNGSDVSVEYIAGGIFEYSTDGGATWTQETSSVTLTMSDELFVRFIATASMLPATIIEASAEVAGVDVGFSITTRAAVPQTTLTLTDGSNTLNNLSGINWAWYDSIDITNLGAVVNSGAIETTDDSGVIQIDLPNTSLSSGGMGTLLLLDASGRKGLYIVAVD